MAEIVVKTAPDEVVAKSTSAEVVVAASKEAGAEAVKTDAVQIGEMKRRRMSMMMNRR